MRRLVELVVCIHLVMCLEGTSVHKPTKGQVWPKPAQERKGDNILHFNSDEFHYEVKNFSCKLLEHAIKRCKKNINSVESIAKRLRSHLSSAQTLHFERYRNKQDITTLQEIQINLKQPCENYPYMEMDESYNLTVSSKSILTAASIWGIMRGLETFSQLFYLSDDYKKVLLNDTEIVDFPQYPFRGLMLDTSRHYLSVANILKTLDAMAMNKMNVLHWHIVDDQSFPYQSDKFPELSNKGAFYASMVYTKQDIMRIVEFARRRGIRVVPEFDTPGHVNSWISHPEVLAKCDNSRRTLNPLKNETYNLIKDLFTEIQKWFPDQYFHLGGDEVDTTCWTSDPEISNYMKTHKIADPYQLQKMYTETIAMLLRKGTVPIVWEEVYFNASASLSNDSLIHIWGWNWDEKMAEVLSNGHRVLFSSYWYLDYKFWKYEFQDFYTGDPRLIVYNKTNNHDLGKNIMGGEACMWGEMVDDNNVISRVWPRASSPAEVLWSFTDGTVPEEAYQRIEEHTCRMVRRGIRAEPGTGAGFCVDVNNVLPKTTAPSGANDTMIWTDDSYEFYSLFM